MPEEINEVSVPNEVMLGCAAVCNVPDKVRAVTPAIPVIFVTVSPTIFPFALMSLVNVASPVKSEVPATLKFVPFSNCKLSLLNLPDILFDPAFKNANSRIPSSVPLLASKILPVILA